MCIFISLFFRNLHQTPIFLPRNSYSSINFITHAVFKRNIFSQIHINGWRESNNRICKRWFTYSIILFSTVMFSSLLLLNIFLIKRLIKTWFSFRPLILNSKSEFQIPSTQNILACVCLQTILQSLFIIDAWWRRSQTSEHRRNKPGRQLVTFLLVANMAMWAINTLEKVLLYYNIPDCWYYGSRKWIFT